MGNFGGIVVGKILTGSIQQEHNVLADPVAEVGAVRDSPHILDIAGKDVKLIKKDGHKSRDSHHDEVPMLNVTNLVCQYSVSFLGGEDF